MNAGKPLLMLSMPNSGSTWFAATLAEFLPGCRYYDKEFFNPVCNLKHERVLRKSFGSELVSCYRNIASVGGADIDLDIKSTWGSESYTFTKECMSPLKLNVFLRHFNVFLFMRKAENTFPPKRVRVWSFYEHAWHSLLDNDFSVGAMTTQGRAQEAHHILQTEMLMMAAKRSTPVLWWEDLFAIEDAPGLPGLPAWLGGMCGGGSDLAKAIVERRQATARG